MNNLINMNPMMGNMNRNMHMNKEQFSNIDKTFKVIFRKVGSHGRIIDNHIMVSIKENEKISDIIQKYRKKNF